MCLNTDHPIRRELIVGTALDTAEKTAIAARKAAVAGECTADVTANVEAGPVIHRRRIGWSLSVGVRRSRKISRNCRPGRAERKKANTQRQGLPHLLFSTFPIFRQRAFYTSKNHSGSEYDHANAC